MQLMKDEKEEMVYLMSWILIARISLWNLADTTTTVRTPPPTFTTAQYAPLRQNVSPISRFTYRTFWHTTLGTSPSLVSLSLLLRGSAADRQS